MPVNDNDGICLNSISHPVSKTSLLVRLKHFLFGWDLDKASLGTMEIELPDQFPPWQPIETADLGKELLLCGSKYHYEETVSGHTMYGNQVTIYVGWYSHSQRKWVTSAPFSYAGGTELVPTHWMPLPELPRK